MSVLRVGWRLGLIEVVVVVDDDGVKVTDKVVVVDDDGVKVTDLAVVVDDE